MPHPGRQHHKESLRTPFVSGLDGASAQLEHNGEHSLATAMFVGRFQHGLVHPHNSCVGVIGNAFHCLIVVLEEL